MGTVWTDDEYRIARITLVGLSMAGWPVFFAWDAMVGCSSEYCEPTHIEGGDLELAALIVGVLHLGLLVSLSMEHGGWVARLIGAVCLLPVFALAASWTGDIVLSGSPTRFYPPFVSLLLLHAMQMWRLSGFSFPRMQPVMDGSLSSNLHTYAAPGAERNVAR